MKAKEVTELLFHPANFKISDDSLATEHDMNSEHFNDMMFKIQDIYKRIHDKLKLWTRFKKMKMRPENEINLDGKFRSNLLDLNHFNSNQYFLTLI